MYLFKDGDRFAYKHSGAHSPCIIEIRYDRSRNRRILFDVSCGVEIGAYALLYARIIHKEDQPVNCPRCGQELKPLINGGIRVGYYPCICTEIVYNNANDIKNGKPPANLWSNID